MRPIINLSFIGPNSQNVQKDFKKHNDNNPNSNWCAHPRIPIIHQFLPEFRR